MRVANTKKFIRSVLIILGIIFSLTLFISKTTFSHTETKYKIIYVSEGDTLWNIAKFNQANNDYYKNKDIRHILNDLIKINNLKNSNININQELLIPIV